MKTAQQLYDEILEAVRQYDDEAAHSREDSLMELVVDQLIAGNIEEAVKSAELSLVIRKMDFARWCA